MARDALPADAAVDVLAPGQQVAVPGTQPPRVVDEAWGLQTSANIPGAGDSVGRVLEDWLAVGDRRQPAMS